MNLDMKLKFNFNKRNKYKNICSIEGCNNSAYANINNKHIEACPNCVFNNYFCHGLLCNIVVLKVVKDEEMRNNK